MLAWWWLVRPKVSRYSSLGADTWCALIWTALGQMGTPVRAMAWIGWDVKLLGHDMGARLSSRQACTGQFYASRLERYVGSESTLGAGSYWTTIPIHTSRWSATQETALGHIGQSDTDHSGWSGNQPVWTINIHCPVYLVTINTWQNCRWVILSDHPHTRAT